MIYGREELSYMHTELHFQCEIFNKNNVTKSHIYNVSYSHFHIDT